MGNGKSGLRNSEWEDCEAPKIVELGIRNFPNSAIRISSIPNSAFRNPQSAIPSPLRNSEWEDCEAPKIVELGIRNFPNSAIRISSISPSPIPHSAIRNPQFLRRTQPGVATPATSNKRVFLQGRKIGDRYRRVW